MRTTAAFLLQQAAQAQPTGKGLVNPCLKSPHASMPFCDASLSLDQRVTDAVKRLSLPEKVGALASETIPLPSLGLPAYNWWSEATHGIAHVRNDKNTPYESNFALPITTACSFNRSLWKATGQQIGIEARAFMNVGNAYSTFWAPVVNIVRDPRWGRNIETPGEDPYLTSQYAINFVKGMESNPLDTSHIQASACCKHFVANELEKWNNTDRKHFNAQVTQQDLMDSYLVPFQACVEGGNVSGLMCSYNAVNGVPSCANDWLLETVARGEWNFDGYVTSDCDADSDVFNSHHYTRTPAESVRDILRAGTDIDCGAFISEHIVQALATRVVNETDVDLALHRAFRVRFRLGHFDPPGPLQKIAPDTVCTDAALDLAREGARQGTVLLKNRATVAPAALNATTAAVTDTATLPIEGARLEAIKHVAVIGPNANLSQKIAGYYAGKSPCGGNYWNLVDAVAQQVSPRCEVVVAKGVPSVTASTDPTMMAEAVAAAEAADLVVLAIGQDGSIEHEGRDRSSIALSQAQLELVAKVTNATKDEANVVVVILTAGAVDVTPLLNNSKIGAILQAGQPSVTILGVGDIVFGRRAPAGLMVQMIYPASFVNEVSLFDMNMRPGPSAFPPAPGQPGMGVNPGRTHRFYTKKPVVPFGYGLSFTTWKYTVVEARAGWDSARSSSSSSSMRDLLQVPLRRIDELLRRSSRQTPDPELLETDAAPLTYAVNVTNTGRRDSDHVVLGFSTPPGAGTGGVPLQSLFGFERVHVKAGETILVTIPMPAVELTQVDANGNRHAHAGSYKVHFGVKEAATKGMGYTETGFVAVYL